MELQMKVAQAVHVLNHDSQSCNRVAANQWLVQFQQTDAAWEVATSILTSNCPQPFVSDFEVEFFAAQILKRKIQSEGSYLQMEAKDALLNALLLAANRFSLGPPQLLTQICLALSALMLHAIEHCKPIEKLFCSLQNLESHDEGNMAVLEMLTVLPEVVDDQSADYRNSSTQRREYGRELLSHTSVVLEFLHRQSAKSFDSSSQLQDRHRKILRCLLSWVRVGCFSEIPPSSLAGHPLLGFVFNSLQVSSSFGLAIDVLIELVSLHEREKHSVLGNEGTNAKATMKPIIYFQTWRVGILFFAIGNCLNFISFGYAAQSLLAALGSIQFVSNIAFAYFVLKKTVTIKVLVATAFIVLGNIFLVAFGNHQSPVYTPEQLAEKYSSITFLLYCFSLVIVVALHHSIYKRGELMLALPMNESGPYWHMLLPFSYAVVSGAVGSCSVLFAKSLSNMLRLSMSSGYSLHSWFTYSMLLLFLSTAGFWMARLNEGLSLFDAILIVPMFQIAWTFFSICTGFVYFQEYQVFDALRTTMFILGMISVFVGISLLAPDESKGEVKDGPFISTASNLSQDEERLFIPSEDSQIKDIRSFGRVMLMKAANMIVKAKAAGSVSLGLGEDSLHASSVLVMPMVSSKITGFRGGGLDRAKILSARVPDWRKFTVEDGETIMETTAMLPQAINLD